MLRYPVPASTRAGAARQTPEARALISLAGAAAPARFAEALGESVADRVESVAADERAFLTVADVQGWDDRERDRLEFFVETLLEEPAVHAAIFAFTQAVESGGQRPDRPPTRPLPTPQLEALSLNLDDLRAWRPRSLSARRFRRLGPGEPAR